ncbi:hypothetical protein SAMN04488025_10242 [Planifilum fulgidum]|jgi:hypothetical protein|uniref:YugN-like family protein n=1 Tax=Planifilum fulgidum TaxID=201973 RepID=A0A1I2KMP2_9BACL|nr:hypothetical protein [Planifilum fulgidum]SFF66391.1 hypothetical protein SAMN04488025_10242 [Planifilum fulgidum]
MRLLAKRITGIVCPRRVIDQTLTSQGFVRRRQHPPVYDIQIEDVASGTVYRLRIPTDSPHPDLGSSDETLLRLGPPSIRCNKSMKGHLRNQPIPSSVLTAANEKIAEIASYLRTPSYR